MRRRRMPSCRRVSESQPSTARVQFFVKCFQALAIHVRVDLGGRDVTVTEKLLNDSQVGTSLEQMGGK